MLLRLISRRSWERRWIFYERIKDKMKAHYSRDVLIMFPVKLWQHVHSDPYFHISVTAFTEITFPCQNSCALMWLQRAWKLINTSEVRSVVFSYRYHCGDFIKGHMTCRYVFIKLKHDTVRILQKMALTCTISPSACHPVQNEHEQTLVQIFTLWSVLLSV